jgi:predicted metal-dependent hydrolase
VTVTPAGEVLVTLPTRAPARWADELVRDKADWIDRHVTRTSHERARLRARPRLEDGRDVALGGVSHRFVVRLQPALERRSVVIHDDTSTPTLRVLLARADERPVGQILEIWLRAEARATIERRVAVRAPQLGAKPKLVRIGDQQSRWGSASRKGTVSFSWRLILAPAAVLDAIVVHELAHLVFFDHSRRFWRLVRSVTPHADAARRWLREHESELRAALD